MLYDRYYYSKLNTREKQAYKKVYAAMENYEPSVTINDFNGADIPKLMSAINLDNPHLFFVDFHCELQSDLFSQTIVLKYFYNKADTVILTEKVKKVCSKILSKVTGKTEFERELSLHDVLVKNVLYDDIAKTDILKYHARSNTILGVLFYKTAVCEGIAKTFKLLLNALNIKCIIVKGKAFDDSISDSEQDNFHAWNIVKIDGKAYHVDLTWNINLSNKNMICHTYFNLTDNDISADHLSLGSYPSCDTEDNNYFYKNSLVVRSKSDLCQIVENAIRTGKNSVEFRIAKNLPIAKSSMTSFVSDCIKNVTNSQQAYSLCSFEPSDQNVYCFMWKFK